MGLSAQAKHFALTHLAQDYSFDQREVVGIEAELTGLPIKQVAEILLQILHGTLLTHETREEGLNSKGEFVRFTVASYKIKGSLIGDVDIKPEDNTFDEAAFMDTLGEAHTVEIVSSPMNEEEVLLLSQALQKVRAEGGVGTHDSNAVSLQVNVQIVGARRPYKTPKYLLKLLRDYYDPGNHQVLMEHFDLPEIRKPYIGRPSEGLLKKLNTPSYAPTTRTFYDDVMYRQTFEFLSKDSNAAWSLPLAFIKEKVLKELETKGLNDVMMRSFKWNDIKLTALLIYWFPNDPLSKALVKTTWFRGYPAIEFRAPNNDFNLKDTAAEILSLVRSARTEAPLRLNSPCEALLF